MQVELTKPVCALCRQEMPEDSAEREAPSRLCGGCRSMVERILPRAGARVEVRPGGHSGLGGAAVSVADTYESPPPMAFQAPEPEAEFPEAVSDFDEDRYDASETPSYDPDDEVYLESETQPQPLPDEDTRTGGLPGIDSEPIIFSSPRIPDAPASEQPVAQADATHPGETAAGYAEETKTDDYKEATDPWEDPLPAWEYSANEYPVLLNESRSGNWKKMVVPAAVILLFAFAAAGYALIYLPSSESQEASAVQAPAQNPLPAAEQPTGDESAGGQTPQPQAEQLQAEQPRVEQASPAPPTEAASTTPDASTATGESARPAPAAVEAVSAESPGGAFSLQAASFPDEAAARQFSEHLARAGIQGRIVAAQLGRRGKWYRVRVGRFASPAEAERYAAQARARSASLGMNVQLIVCDYEKP